MCSPAIRFVALSGESRERIFRFAVGVFLASIIQGCASRESIELDRQIAAVRSGRAKSLCLEESSGTDGLLEQLANVPEVEEVRLDYTDVSDDGLRSLRFLPRLRSLIICGGNPGVGDRGFAYIKGIATLDTLVLSNTRVTDQSLPSLKDLPNLRTLVLYYHDVWRGPTFTDAGSRTFEDVDETPTA